MEQLLKKKDIVEILNVTMATVNYWICKNKIEHIKLDSGAVRFKREAIEKMISESTIKPSEKNTNGGEND